MANFQSGGTFTPDDIKNNIFRQLAMVGNQNQQQPGFNMGAIPQQSGLFSGLSAYNPEWLKTGAQSGAMPYAQFAAQQNMQSANAAMPDAAAMAEAERIRQMQMMQQQMAQYQPAPRSWYDGQGNGGA